MSTGAALTYAAFAIYVGVGAWRTHRVSEAHLRGADALIESMQPAFFSPRGKLAIVVLALALLTLAWPWLALRNLLARSRP